VRYRLPESCVLFINFNRGFIWRRIARSFIRRDQHPLNISLEEKEYYSYPLNGRRDQEYNQHLAKSGWFWNIPFADAAMGPLDSVEPG